LLIGSQAKPLRKVRKTTVVMMFGSLSGCGGVGGIIRACRQIPSEQAAGNQRGDDYSFRCFHKIFDFLFQIRRSVAKWRDVNS
jgi:hypothetical protein